MAFASNIAAMNAARKMLAAQSIGKEALKEYFSFEKHDGEWHAMMIKPFPIKAHPADSLSIPPAAPLGAARDPMACLAIERDGQYPFLTGNIAASEQALKALNESNNAARKSMELTAAAQAFFANIAKLPPQISNQPSPAMQALISDAAEAIEQFGEDALEEFAEQQRQAEALANAQQTSELKKGKLWIHASSCKSPVKRVWAIADAMIADAIAANKPAPSRKEVQEECERQGVASGTARTQYQAWKKAKDNTLANAEHAAELSKRFR